MAEHLMRRHPSPKRLRVRLETAQAQKQIVPDSRIAEITHSYMYRLSLRSSPFCLTQDNGVV